MRYMLGRLNYLNYLSFLVAFTLEFQVTSVQAFNHNKKNLYKNFTRCLRRIFTALIFHGQLHGHTIIILSNEF